MIGYIRVSAQRAAIPANPVAVVRENLCRELHEVLEGCERRAYDAEETAPPLVQRRINNARDKALAAWRSYQLGELDEAREAATAAAAIVDIYAPLARWLAAERQLPAADVLRHHHDARVVAWRTVALRPGLAPVVELELVISDAPLSAGVPLLASGRLRGGSGARSGESWIRE